MKQLAIIADDLSSATDCGIQIARSGLQTLVVLGDYSPVDEKDAVEVVSLDTDSRSVPPEIAFSRVQEMSQVLASDGYEKFYKSMDSTLRGNLGPEVDAIMDNTNFDFAIIAPAYPHYGRTTIRGQHYLNGTLIDQTEFASDPQCPVKDADLVRRVAGRE